MRHLSLSKTTKAFTLVELLVVIGIIAALISILLPALNRARSAANAASCLSNLRQLSTAMIMFANDHKGTFPSASDDRWMKLADPSRTRYAYRENPSASDGSGITGKDWASSLIRYLGGPDSANFQNAPDAQSRVFVCPADSIVKDNASGYYLLTNVVVKPYPVSYGLNFDICALVDPTTDEGRCGLSDNMSVAGGPLSQKNPSVQLGKPAQGRVSKIRRPSETLLIADCGTLPRTGSNLLDWSDGLAFTTNYNNFRSQKTAADTTLAAMMETSWLKDRVPLERHSRAGITARGAYVSGTNVLPKAKGGRINIGFADGHGESVAYEDFGRVFVSPYTPK